MRSAYFPVFDLVFDLAFGLRLGARQRSAPRPRYPRGPVAALVLMLLGAAASAQESPGPETYLLDLQAYDYLQPLGHPREGAVRNYLVPLGAVQKVRGVWAPRDSERVSGDRLAQTWQLDPGFTAEEIVAALDAQLAADTTAESLFSCDAVSCGSSVQWANRIFRERLLYGTQASQRYRAWGLEREGRAYRLLVYGSARSADRQFVHVEFLSLDQ